VNVTAVEENAMDRKARLVVAVAGCLLCIVPGLAASATRLIGDLPHRGPHPLLELAGMDTEYGVVATEAGAHLRTIVTKPSNSRARLPAVLFVPWLSCDSVDFADTSTDGWSLMLKQLSTQSHRLSMRVDKSGVGDSTGTPCDQLDYETELGQYRAAFNALRARADVDPERVVIFGGSMGATYAPLIAAGQKVAGVIVWGGGATTWFERMLAFERHALELGGTEPARLSTEMKMRANYFSHYLLEGEAPEVIARADPELAKVWPKIVGTSGNLHYGRPLAFHQQAQRQNWPAAWAQVHAPVLAVYGEYDWFESPAAMRLIADVVNRERPGSAQFREIPGLNHHFMRFNSPVAAYKEQDGVADPSQFVTIVLGWLRQLP
jgi:pimeloyl-ACP methyl ester carboxylesterase